MESYRELDFHLRGFAPLMVHNGHLADPLGEWSKKLKEVSGKRKKTDADHEKMSEIEWFAGFYVDSEQRPVIPGLNIETMLWQAGKKDRLGENFKAGVLSDGFWPIIYDGPKTPQQIWESKSRASFVDRRNVKLGGKATVMRSRPIFHKWELKLKVSFLPELLNESQVRKAMETAGNIIGLGDFKPKFGRFQIV